MKKYNPAEIEGKWQAYWQEQGTYVANLNSNKPKYFAFGMFNYPSGAGIHVGHVKNFTLPDVLLRAKRQQGYEAYSPVGFDSFGLPAENYAIKTGQSPRKTTDDAIANYRKQYSAVGFSQDWSKEIDTSQPEYYKWTQWCFLQLHKQGLAYQKESLQWWCDQCKTVLADEQVIGGKCWRHGGPSDPHVGKKSLKQWFFKITDYADEILEATDELNWTPWVKVAQKNWIGKSNGAEVDFALEGLGSNSNDTLKIFTTAYETIYGATFMVLAPEHELVQKYAQMASNHLEIEAYVLTALKRSDLDREKQKTKTGVQIQGLLAINPINGAKVPVWVADYVLPGYGTGAIMAVPGQDERDNEFATKYNLPIVFTTSENKFVNYSLDIKSNLSNFKMQNSNEFDGVDLATAREQVLQKLISTNVANQVSLYKLRDWLISRQRYWGAPIPIIHCEEHGAVPVPESELPVKLPVIEDYQPSGEGSSPLAKVTEWVNAPCPTCGKMGKRETDTMDGYVCSSWYQLRYTDPHNNQQAWDTNIAKKWLPVDFYNGGDHATAHLLYARFFTRFFYKMGLLANPEPFAKMYFHAKILAPDGTAFSKSKGNGVDPLQVISDGHGADALRTYILFMAPPDVESPWSINGVQGCFRFMNRVWNLVNEFLEREVTAELKNQDEALLRLANRMVKKVTEDIDSVKLNTAISTMMEYVNELYKLKETDQFASSSWEFAINSLLQCLAPFAPHITEQLWHDLGNNSSIHVDNWPVLNPSYLESNSVELPVQLKGKFKLRLNVPVNSSADYIQQQVASLVPEFNPDTFKIIYVPNKIVNIVPK